MDETNKPVCCAELFPVACGTFVLVLPQSPGMVVVTLSHWPSRWHRFWHWFFFGIVWRPYK